MSSIFEILDLGEETVLDWLSYQFDDCIRKSFDLEEELEGDLQIVVRIYKEAELRSLRTKARYYDGFREDLRKGKALNDIVDQYKRIGDGK